MQNGLIIVPLSHRREPDDAQCFTHRTHYNALDLLVIFCVSFFFVFSIFACRLCLCCRLPTHMSLLSRSIHCDDAYSYGDNFIYLYSHYMIYQCDGTTKALTNSILCHLPLSLSSSPLRLRKAALLCWRIRWMDFVYSTFVWLSNFPLASRLVFIILFA